MTKDLVRERLAEYAHSAWAGWMRYLFEKSPQNSDGSVTIPSELVERWTRQTNTPYEELPEGEKKSDLKEADKMLAIMSNSPDYERAAAEIRLLRKMGR